MRSKYHSKKITVGEQTFDSKLEYQRWLFLSQLENDGKIVRLRRQVSYELLPRQTEVVKKVSKTGRIKFVEAFREHPVTYKADFVYKVLDTETFSPGAYYKTIIEDTKGFHTPDYIIKRKLMRWQGNPIKEVTKATEPIGYGDNS